MVGFSRIFVALAVILLSSISVSGISHGNDSSTHPTTSRLLKFLFKKKFGLGRRRRRGRSRRGGCYKYAKYQFRSFDGKCNNLGYPHLGAAHQPFFVLTGRLRSRRELRNLPNARRISNVLNNERNPVPNRRGMSELVTFFGQFLDHTITETEQSKTVSMHIKMNANDPVFTRDRKMNFFRTIRKGSGRRRAPENKLSSYVDAASVYGVNEKMARKLREGQYGRLYLPNDLLPKNKKGEFEAGDMRVNENPVLIAMHLLWAREHNKVAEEVANAFPDYDDEEIYQLSRHIVAAELQAVTYYGFIPALTGRILPKYNGYNPRIPAAISNRFSTVAFRVGHTLLNRTISSVDENGRTRALELADCFFQPKLFVRAGIDNLFRGMMTGFASEVDVGVSGEVRNFLKTSKKVVRFDLSALNIQRGRDHGVPACNELRRTLGLKPYYSFSDLTNNPHLLRKLRFLYMDRIEDLDAWICGLVERHAPGSSLGPLFDQIIRREFRRLRDGDRFYFENTDYFTREQIAKLPLVRTLVSGDPAKLKNIMRQIIYRNTGIPDSQINRDPFFV